MAAGRLWAFCHALSEGAADAVVGGLVVGVWACGCPVPATRPVGYVPGTRWRGAPWAVMLGVEVSACWPIRSVAGALPVLVIVSVLLVLAGERTGLRRAADGLVRRGGAGGGVRTAGRGLRRDTGQGHRRGGKERHDAGSPLRGTDAAKDMEHVAPLSLCGWADRRYGRPRGLVQTTYPAAL